jgi:hypothetical protein
MGGRVKSIRLLCALVIVGLLSVGCNKSSAPAGSPSSSTGGNAASAPAGGDTAGGSGQNSASNASAAPQPIVIPAGKVLTVRLSQALSSKGSQSGESFMGTLAEPVSVNGQPVIEKGASVRGTVVEAKAMGHFKGGALLQLKLDSITFNGQEHPIHSSLWSQALKGKGKRSAVAIGGGTAVGAALGGIFGGGKGAAIGALAGGGAGTAGAAYTGNKEIELPAESALRFTLKQSLEVQ